MRKPIYSLLLLSSITFSGCSSILNNLPGVYSLDIQQGNIINQEMIDQLRPKMTKRQVLYIMGSSMLIDVFHQKRWDYLYSEQPGGELRKQKRLSLFFDGDELIGVQGDFRPSTLPVIRESNETTVDVPARDLDKTLWEKITRLFSDDTPNKAEPVKPEPIPLEENNETNIEVIETVTPVIDNQDTTNEIISVTPLKEENSPDLEKLSD